MKTPLICHIYHICTCLCISNSKYIKQKRDYLRKNLMMYSYINIQGLNKIMETPVIYHTYKRGSHYFVQPLYIFFRFIRK